MIIPFAGRGIAVGTATIAAVAGVAASLHYHQLGLALSHYDARAHLVVARRIFDSITPGWQQIGAVWLPVPHLLNAIPVQIDGFYRTGISAIAISITSFAVATGSIAWIVAILTGSSWAAAAGALVFALNPNILYLQATPMTEPLLIALLLLAIAGLIHAHMGDAEAEAPRRRRSGRMAGWAFALACMTRYEAWPVTIVALAVSLWTHWQSGTPLRRAAARAAAIAAYPSVAIAGFLIFSRVVVGSWFPSGFFVPENPSKGQPLAAIADIVWGVHALSGSGVLAAAAIGGVVLLGVGLTRSRAFGLIPLALLAGAAVPWAAFVEGHPYRIRYMTLLIAAQAILAGTAAGFWTRARSLAVPALVVLTVFELRPLTASAPLVAESQWDGPNAAARDPVSRQLAAEYRGETVMASMGSLGHYMHDLARYGFELRDFLHEGNGDIWLNALDDPRPYVGWVLVEEKAEGGDMLARRARENPAFLNGFSRVCDGAGVALYRRRPAPVHEDAKRLEPHVERREVRPTSEVDPAAGELLLDRKIALGALPPDLCSKPPGP